MGPLWSTTGELALDGSPGSEGSTVRDKGNVRAARSEEKRWFLLLQAAHRESLALRALQSLKSPAKLT